MVGGQEFLADVPGWLACGPLQAEGRGLRPPLVPELAREGSCGVEADVVGLHGSAGGHECGAYRAWQAFHGQWLTLTLRWRVWGQWPGEGCRVGVR